MPRGAGSKGSPSLRGLSGQRQGHTGRGRGCDSRCTAGRCHRPQRYQRGVVFVPGMGSWGRQMPWMREGEAARLVACKRRPTNSSSVVSQPRPLRRLGENPILEASFPDLTIENQERYFYLVLQVGLETSLSGCFIVCVEIKPSHAPHKALHSSQPEALLCSLYPVLSMSLDTSPGGTWSRLTPVLTPAQRNSMQKMLLGFLWWVPDVFLVT